MPFLETLQFWHWWVLGLMFLCIEVFAPGVVFLWMAVAAGVVGAVLLAAPGLAWQYQGLIFALVTVVSVFLWRLWLTRHPTESDHPTLNRRAEQYVGRVFTLEEPIVNGRGLIRVDDSRWRIAGPDLPAGTKVRVIGVDGTLLRVEVGGEA